MNGVISSRPPIRFLVVVTAAALVPGVLVAILLAGPLDRDIDTARREQRGLEYFTAIKAFTKAALDHRRIAGDYVAGTADNVAVARKADAVNEALQKLDELDGHLGNDNTTRALEALRGEWEKIGKELPAWARVDDFNSFADHSATLLRHARDLATAAGEANDLAADADPMRRGMHESLVTLVDDSDVASQVALVTKQAARTPRLDRGAEGRLHRLLGRLEHNGAQLRHDVHAAAERGPEKYRGKLADGLAREETLRTELGKLVETRVLRDPTPVDEPTAAAVAIAADRAVDQNLDLFEPLQWSLFDSLGEHAAKRDRPLVWAGVAVVVGAIVALLATFAMSRRMAQPAKAGIDPARVERLKRLAEDLHEAAANAVGPSPEKLREAAGRLAKIASSARGIEPAVRVLEEMADEASVAALNVELYAANGGVAVAPEVDRLADRSTAAARRVIELARTIDHEVAAADKGVREFGAGDASRLATLTVELCAAIESLG